MKVKEEDAGIEILTGEYKTLSELNISLSPNVVELDLGCGKGSFSTQLAERYPNSQIFAADVMIGRIRKLHKRNKREKISNIIPLRVEAKALLGYIFPDLSIDRVHILCPDPWPKDRHRGNRLLTSSFLENIHRVLKKNGSFHFATDDMNYNEIVIGLLEKTPLFKQENERLSDIKDIKSDFEVRWNSKGKEVNHTNWTKQ